MADPMRSAAPSWHPLRCAGTDMAMPVLLMAKLIALAYLLRFEWRTIPGVFLPFVPVLEPLAGSWFAWVLKAAAVGGALALLFNRRVRVASIVMGSAVLLAVLASKPYSYNARVITGALLVLAGLTTPGREPRLIRAQIAVMYLGAGLSKLTDADWRSGEAFAAWAAHRIPGDWYEETSALLPEDVLSAALGWSAILVELWLVPGLLVPRLRVVSVWLAIVFHTTLLVATRETFGMFYYSVLASFVVYFKWPATLVVFHDPVRAAGRAARFCFGQIDVEGVLHWARNGPAPGAPGRARRDWIRVVAPDQLWSGIAGVRQLLLANPATFLAIGCVLAFPRNPYRHWMSLPILLFFLPQLLQSLTDAVRRLRIPAPPARIEIALAAAPQVMSVASRGSRSRRCH
jgi:hypothetical protein